MGKTYQLFAVMVCLCASAATFASPIKTPAATIKITILSTSKEPSSMRVPLSVPEARSVKNLLGQEMSIKKLPANCFKIRECDGRNCTVTIECY